MRFLCVDVKKSFRKIYKINVKLWNLNSLNSLLLSTKFDISTHYNIKIGNKSINLIEDNKATYEQLNLHLTWERASIKIQYRVLK